MDIAYHSIQVSKSTDISISDRGYLSVPKQIGNIPLDTLITNWGGDYLYELGPCINGPCIGENVPNLTPAFDTVWDIEDLMSFVLMYNGSNGRTLSRESIIDMGTPPIFKLNDSFITLILPQYTYPVHHVWFQIAIPVNDMIFHASDFSEQFDMVLNRSTQDYNIGEWSLINLDAGGIQENEIILGSFQTHFRDTQIFEIQYKITSKNILLSSGILELEYVPVPNKFEISQGYPNPFNPIATIKYGLPMDVDLSISVYDIQGRLVTFLNKGYITAGYHEAVWDASQYSSGIYILHMIARDINNQIQFNSYQKMMLVK